MFPRGGWSPWADACPKWAWQELMSPCLRIASPSAFLLLSSSELCSRSALVGRAQVHINLYVAASRGSEPAGPRRKLELVAVCSSTAGPRLWVLHSLCQTSPTGEVLLPHSLSSHGTDAPSRGPVVTANMKSWAQGLKPRGSPRGCSPWQVVKVMSGQVSHQGSLIHMLRCDKAARGTSVLPS